MTDYSDVSWRVGTKLGRTLYAADHDDPKQHTYLGMMETTELAKQVVDLHNSTVAFRANSGLPAVAEAPKPAAVTLPPFIDGLVTPGDYWLIRFTRDPSRGEYTNIGVVLRTDHGAELSWNLNFDTGNPDVHNGWMAYFARKASSEAEWQYAISRPLRGNYRIDRAGHLVERPADWADAVDQLYRDLVAP